MDRRPQELLLATLDGLALEYSAGAVGGVAFSQLAVRLRNLQVGLCVSLGGGVASQSAWVLRAQCTRSAMGLVLRPRPQASSYLTPNCAQVDDQLPGTPHPVVLLPLDASRQEGPAAEPLLIAMAVTQVGLLACCCRRCFKLPLRACF